MNFLSGASIISLVFAVIGLYLIINYLRQRAKQQASESWGSIQGSVDKSWVEENYSTDSEGDSRTTYYPKVEYVYSFMGQEYHGDRITFGPKQGGGCPGAEKVIAKYPGESSVTVYYDPNNPEESVLERKLSKISLVYGIICLIVAVITFVIRL